MPSKQLDEYPPCPDCETDIWVVGYSGAKRDWECIECDRVFND